MGRVSSLVCITSFQKAELSSICLNVIKELIRIIVPVTVICILTAQSVPKLEHLFLFEKIPAALKLIAKPPCCHTRRRSLKILPQPLHRTVSLVQQNILAEQGQTTEGRCSAFLCRHYLSLTGSGQPVAQPLTWAVSPFGRKKP